VNYIPDIGKAGKIDRLCNPFTMLSLDSADTGISETGEKTRRVRYVRFAVYFHMGTREWAKRSGGKGKEKKKRWRWRKTRKTARTSDVGRVWRNFARLCSGNIPRKRRINSPSEVSDVSNVRTGQGRSV